MSKVETEIGGKRRVSERSKKQYSAQIDKHIDERILAGHWKTFALH